jgi:hypothetical protein
MLGVDIAILAVCISICAIGIQIMSLRRSLDALTSCFGTPPKE